MIASHFFKLLIYTITISSVIVGCMFMIPVLRSHIGFTVLVILMFSCLSIVNFFIGEQLARSSNQYLYNNLIVLNFIVKIIFSFSLVFMYVNIKSPSDNWYLAAFILIYVLFTSFEVLFMSKQAKMGR